MAYSKANLKSNDGNAFPIFEIILNRKHVRQMFAYSDYAVGFIQTFLLALPVVWGYQTQ
jgi:hypothetical protein